MKRRLTLVIALVFSMSGIGIAQQAPLHEFYVCAGENMDGRPYTNLMQTRTNGDTVQMRWLDKDGEQEAGAYGFRDEAQIAVVIGAATGAFGVATYTVEGEKLVGRWIFAGAPVVRPEVCEPASAPHKAKPDVDAGRITA